MSGHSKWHNIQGRKNAQDAKRGKIFQKLSRELYMAAKTGGPDPNNNPSLRLVVDKAHAANMPKDNIKRAINKSQDNDDTHYDEVTYEGYGPGGIAVLIHALTDNKNRTNSTVRVDITRHGGTMGSAGSVGYLFDRKGHIVIDRENLDIDEDKMLEDVIDAGGEDLKTNDDSFDIYTNPKELALVRDSLKEKGYEPQLVEMTMIPQNLTLIPEDKVNQFSDMLDALEDNDDVSAVYYAGKFPEEKDL